MITSLVVSLVEGAFAFLAIGHFTSLSYADDVKVPKQATYRDEAWAHFRRRCENDARETINRVVEDVEAIFLIKPRARARESDLSDQYWMGDPYGYSSYEASHPIATYLFDRSGKTVSGRALTPINGYRYVEVSNPTHHEGAKASRYLRYALKSVQVSNSVTKNLETRRRPIPIEVDTLISRYGITWEDISTKEDRQYWVAGGRLTILDLRTSEVVGERVGYVIDPGFGSDHQGRKAWLAVGFISHAFCPRFENRFDRNKEFVAKVLKASARKSNGQ